MNGERPHGPPTDAALVGTIYNPPRARRRWMVKDVLPEGVIRFYSLARWALVDALVACGVRRGDRVLMPGLICREVLASLNIVGATAAFYPVSRGLYAGAAAADLIPAKAVLAVNYFGFPQDLGMFREYCARTGAALIEDNAHGLLSRDANGELLGSRGDAGVFSFRKTIAVPEGGALVLTGTRSMPEKPTALPVEVLAARYRLKQVCRRVAGRLGPVRTLKAIAATRRFRLSLGDSEPSRTAPDAEVRIPSAPNPPALIARGLAVAEPEMELLRRRALYDLAGRIVEAIGGVPVFPRLPPNVVPYGFPVLASPSQAAGLGAHLAKHGLLFARWPDLPAAVAPSAADHYRHLWVVPFLW